jgi:hypothetical protein
MKALVVVGGAGALAVGIALYFVLGSLDALIEGAIEKYGSEITQTRVRVDSVELHIAKGVAKMRGLSVGNPAGFTSDHSMELGELHVLLDVDSVTEDIVRIKQILIDSPSLTFEIGAQGSNIGAIQRNVDEFVGTEEASESSGDGPRLIVENLLIRNGSVRISADFLEQALEMPLPPVQLRNIGSGGAGVTPGQLAGQITTQLARSVSQAVARSGVQQLGDVGAALRGELQQLAGATAGSATRAAGSALVEIGKAAGATEGETRRAAEAVTEGLSKAAGETLKGLFKR